MPFYLFVSCSLVDETLELYDTFARIFVVGRVLAKRITFGYMVDVHSTFPVNSKAKLMNTVVELRQILSCPQWWSLTDLVRVSHF